MQHKMERYDFGEGCISYKNNNVTEFQQLTYKERKMYHYQFRYRYDSNMNIIQIFQMPKDIQEGWGLTSRYYKN